MTVQQKYNVVVRALVAAVAACCGVLLNRGGAWIVYHDSINYRLHDAGFGLLSNAAETAFALGPLLWAGGVVLALPLLLGCVRHVISFRRLVALQVLAYLTLVCGLGSIAAFPFLGLLGATVALWILAMIVAAVSPAETAQLGAPLIVVSALLMSCLLTTGCATHKTMSSESTIQEMQQVVTKYLRTEHHWQPSEYRLEFKTERTTEGFVIVDAMHVDDQKAPVPGGGKSLELYLDPARNAVVRELGFQ